MSKRLYPYSLSADESTREQVEVVGAVPGFDGLVATCEEAVVFDPVSAGNPAIESKGNRSVCSDPLTVVFSRHMDMCGIGDAAFAGWVTDIFIGKEVFARQGTILFCNVHVKDDPAGLFLAVIV